VIWDFRQITEVSKEAVPKRKKRPGDIRNRTGKNFIVDFIVAPVVRTGISSLMEGSRTN
jgi:hypothetical protein